MKFCGKGTSCQCRRHKRYSFDPWVGKITWRRAWQPLQYSCLENPMDRGVWQAIVHSIKRVQHDWSDLAHTHQVYILVILIFDNDNEIAQTVNRLSTMRETWVRSLGWEDPLEKEMATHSSTLAFKIPWTEELGAGYCPCGSRVWHDWVTSLSLSLICKTDWGEV